MSTLKTTYIQHPDATGPAIELTAAGTVALPPSGIGDLVDVDEGSGAADGNVLTYDSSTNRWIPAEASSGISYIGSRYFTSSGTFEKSDPFGNSSFTPFTAMRVKVVGGGGGGGGAYLVPYGGGGGGGGGYAERYIFDSSTLSASISVAVGAGGGSATVGGTSEFGVSGEPWHTAATGGNGGGNAAGGGGSGGSGTAGDFLVAGSGGMSGGNSQNGGCGGNSGMGFGGGGAGRRGRGGGTAGRSYGGGGGAAASESGRNYGGGAGAAGIVVIDFFG